MCWLPVGHQRSLPAAEPLRLGCCQHDVTTQCVSEARKERTPSQPSDARQPGETCIPGPLLFSFPVILHTYTQPAWPSPSREGDCLPAVAWLCFMMLLFKPDWEQRQCSAPCATRSRLLCLSLACDSESSALVLVASASDLRGP